MGARMHALFLPLVLAALAALTPAPPIRAETPPVPLGALARDAARASLATAGLAGDDAELDRLSSRARWSALLPDLRVHVRESSAGMHDYVSSAGTVTSSYFGASYQVEGTLVFHLDRLAYSGQEARIEELRLERQKARERLTQRVIDEVARWSKASAEERDTPADTDAHADAVARRTAAEMALDVWTGGWFSHRLAARAP